MFLLLLACAAVDPVAVDVFSLTLQAWAARAPGLVERGQWFRRRLAEELLRHNAEIAETEPDVWSDRAIGLAFEMAMAGNPAKASVFYDRAASIAGAQPFTFLSERPIAIDIGEAIIIVRADDFYVASVKAGG